MNMRRKGRIWEKDELKTKEEEVESCEWEGSTKQLLNDRIVFERNKYETQMITTQDRGQTIHVFCVPKGE